MARVRPLIDPVFILPVTATYTHRDKASNLQITMWDPSFTMQCQLADSIKPHTLGLKSTTITTGPNG